MSNFVLAAVFIVLGILAAPCSAGAGGWAGEGEISPVPFTAVRLRDGFWSPRVERVGRVTVPHSFGRCEATGRFANFEVAAGRREGGMAGYFFNDSDVYKLIEGAANVLALEPDAALEARCDRVIEMIVAAQEPDGYLYTSRSILDPKNMPPGGEARWSNMEFGHELYCAGHLYEAGVAYFKATGKRALLDAAIRNADLVDSTFGPGKNTHPCGHPEIELALVRLADATGEKKYLDLARFFLETRGRGGDGGRGLFGEYSQDHRPILEQSGMVGHAVRAAYLYAGLTDVGVRTGERAFVEASARLWEDMASGHLYLTGGIGAQARNEGFGEPFDLPSGSAYNETCASIAAAMWSHRLFLATGDGRYMDLVERIIYNAFHSGWSLSGDRFFYPNPLSSGGRRRSEWFACACCPPNICRFVPSIPGFAYAARGREVYVNLFMGGTAEVPLGEGAVTLQQEGNYPWEGRVRITVQPERPGEFDLMIRIPGWSRGEPLPGGLYRFADSDHAAPTIAVNGEPVSFTVERGCARLSRAWKSNDWVDLELPMPVRRVVADERVAACRGRSALQRGPVVYCFEGVDHAVEEVRSLVLEDDLPIAEHTPDLLGGVTVLRGRARPVSRTLDGGRATGEPVAVTAVPYYAWANRAESPMSVWMATAPEAARPGPAPTLAHRSKATASFPTNPAQLSDQLDPASSADQEHGHCHWWPRKGTNEWVQYDFSAPAEVRGVEVYWFDDTGHGQCRVPASWRVMARVGGEWREVEAPSGYGVERDRYNVCAFAPVVAEGLRLEITSREGFAGGVHEWRVHGEPPDGAGSDAGTAAGLLTRWAADMDPDNPLPEHPRPQMVRDSWRSLNGRWQWGEWGPGDEPPIGRALPERIVVPFPVESHLSGVGRSVERMWYRRTFRGTPAAAGQRTLLHLGAVDWHARVWVNGVEVGEHRGGYSPFTLDITDALDGREEHELVVGVWDPTDSGDQPRGKQVRRPEGIWYTPCSGIWGSVWLEGVPAFSIDRLMITTDAAAGRVRIIAPILISPGSVPERTLKRRAVALVEGREVARDESFMDLNLTIPDPRLWSPDDPFLYDLRVEVIDHRGRVVDSVKGYFGLRDVSLGKDDRGRPALLLNGEPLFMVGPLDQGYWPDGIYTAPTDEALRYDLEVTKQLGFNMTRKHVKVEPARWYAWADRLGLLVWQDMPSGNNATDSSREQYKAELRRMIDSLRSHPSIVMWIVFNEGWGQHDTESLTAMVKEYDPTRLVSNASGWTDKGVGDVLDIHNYPEPACPPLQPERAAVLGEFGGLGLAVRGHMWKRDFWGYRTLPDAVTLTSQYEKFLHGAYRLHEERGLAAAVYTQLTDVEIECNGLLTYDRAVIKPDVERITAANRGDFSRMPPEPVVRPVVPASDAEPRTWRYTTLAPSESGEAWAQPGFDDAGWAAAPGGFGREGTPGAIVRTEWTSGEIWIRRTAELHDPLPEDLRLLVHHDEDAEVYLNGRLAARLTGYTTGYERAAIDPEALRALRPGPLVIAVHCRQTIGGQYIDVGLISVEPPPARPAE